MNRRNSPFRRSVALAIFVATLCASPAGAQTEKVLHNFGGRFDGAAPSAGLIFDNHGNLYGTTPVGGFGVCPYGCGNVFELSPNSDGSWSETVLHGFRLYDSEGFHAAPPVIFDHRGNLYGMADCSGVDCGSPIVFELTPLSGGGWTEFSISTLGFNDCGLGCVWGLSFDGTGHLYGVTEHGGFSFGTIFRLTQVSSHNWHELELYRFESGPDGSSPNGPLVLDDSGNAYGTTGDGGSNQLGYVFMLNATGNLRALYSFRGGTDGAQPSAGVVFDAAGNLYGVTAGGGTAGAGTIFKLTPNPDGSWSESVLYSFQGGGDAASPNSPLSFDTAGNLYGSAGGGAYGHGAVFKLSPSGGQWTETVVYSFTGGLDGDGPFGGVIEDAGGNLYGTTNHGGAYPSCQNQPNCGGVAYEITP